MTTLAEELHAPTIVTKSPSLKFNLFLALLSLIVVYAFLAYFDNLNHRIAIFGDNGDFDVMIRAIANWDFSHVTRYMKRIFWGLPLLSATAQAVIPLLKTPGYSIACVSIISCLVAIYFSQKLWGGWITALFTLSSWDWIQRAWLGGNETLFMALILGGFYHFRKQNTLVAILLSSFATLVRPMGFLLLVAFGLVLLKEKSYRSLVYSMLLSILIGGAYLLVLHLAYSESLTNFSAYNTEAGYHLSIPIWGFIQSYYELKLPLSINLKVSAWLGFTLLSLFMLFKSNLYKKLFQSVPAELLFFILYLSFLFTYTAKHWSWQCYPRFIIPILPIMLFALDKNRMLDFLKNRTVLVILAVFSSAVAAISVVGFSSFHLH